MKKHPGFILTLDQHSAWSDHWGCWVDLWDRPAIYKTKKKAEEVGFQIAMEVPEFIGQLSVAVNPEAVEPPPNCEE